MPPKHPPALLLVVCAGDGSLHHHGPHPWVVPSSDSRKYDVAVLHYGKSNEMAAEYEKHAVHFSRVKGPKWKLVRTFLLEQKSLWSRYEYIGFPDDDLCMAPALWNSLVEHADKHRLDVFQPAIVPPPRNKDDSVKIRLADSEYCDQFISHAHVLPAVDYRDEVRFVNLVEIMVPVFRRSALEVCTHVSKRPGPAARGGGGGGGGKDHTRQRTRRNRRGRQPARKRQHTVRPSSSDQQTGILVHPSIQSGWGMDYVLPATVLPCHRFDLPETHPDNSARKTYRYAIVDAVVAVHTKPLGVQKGRVAEGSFYDTLNISPETEMDSTMRRWNVRRPFRPETTRHVPIPVDYETPLPRISRTTDPTHRTIPSHTELPSFLQANLNRETLAIRRGVHTSGRARHHDDLESFYYKLGYGFHAKIRNNRFIMVRDLGSFQSRNSNTVQMIRAVLQQYQIPDTDMLVCTDDKLRTPDWADTAGVPILVMAKKRAQTYFTYPDHTFWNWKEACTRGWDAERTDIMNASATTYAAPFRKEPVAFFRGNLQTSYIRKVFGDETKRQANGPGARARRTLDVHDVRLDNRNDNRNDTTTTHGQKASAFVTLRDHSKYKYLLHIPGRSYAGRLKYLLATNSCVVYVQKRPEHEYREFWYDGLVDGQTCLFARDANRYDKYDSPRPDANGDYRDDDTVAQVKALVTRGKTVPVSAQQALANQIQWKPYWACLLLNVGRMKHNLRNNLRNNQ